MNFDASAQTLPTWKCLKSARWLTTGAIMQLYWYNSFHLCHSQSSVDDYDNVPVEAFGAAMLRGMGWEEGKPIGLTNKG